MEERALAQTVDSGMGWMDSFEDRLGREDLRTAGQGEEWEEDLGAEFGHLLDLYVIVEGLFAQKVGRASADWIGQDPRVRVY